MAIRKILAILVGFCVLGAVAAPAGAQTDAELAVKYKNAKALHAAGKHMDAIKIFAELKAFKYHPILDYRIGQCQEALGNYKMAMYHFGLYVKYYGTKKVGKNHPTKEATQKKIQELKTAAARPAARPEATPAATPGATPRTTPPPTTGSTVPAPATTTRRPATATPGTAPPPGQPHYGHYPGYPGYPPPPKVTKPAVFPRGRALYILLDIGYGGPAGDMADHYDGGVGVNIGFYYRPVQFVSLGALITVNQFEPNNEQGHDESALDVYALMDLRGHLPLRKWDWRPWYAEVWGGLAVGLALMKARLSSAGPGDILMRGVAVGGSLGGDVYPVHWFSFGLVARVLQPFYEKGCSKVGGTEVCQTTKQLDATGFKYKHLTWYLGLTATFHFYRI